MDELINLSFLVTKNMSLLLTIIQGFQLNQTRNSKRGESFLKSERPNVPNISYLKRRKLRQIFQRMAGLTAFSG